MLAVGPLHDCPPQMRRLSIRLAGGIMPLAALLVVLHPGPSAAQERERQRNLFQQIKWSEGPGKGKLAEVAEVGVPGSCRFADGAGAKLFMEATQNPPTAREVGVLLCADARSRTEPWF